MEGRKGEEVKAPNSHFCLRHWLHALHWMVFSLQYNCLFWVPAGFTYRPRGYSW